MHYSRLLLLVATLAALAACQPKGTASAAAAGSDTSPPVATVNGAPISRDFYEFYIKGITQGKNCRRAQSAAARRGARQPDPRPPGGRGSGQAGAR